MFRIASGGRFDRKHFLNPFQTYHEFAEPKIYESLQQPYLPRRGEGRCGDGDDLDLKLTGSNAVLFSLSSISGHVLAHRASPIVTCGPSDLSSSTSSIFFATSRQSH